MNYSHRKPWSILLPYHPNKDTMTAMMFLLPQKFVYQPFFQHQCYVHNCNLYRRVTWHCHTLINLDCSLQTSEHFHRLLHHHKKLVFVRWLDTHSQHVGLFRTYQVCCCFPMHSHDLSLELSLISHLSMSRETKLVSNVNAAITNSI